MTFTKRILNIALLSIVLFSACNDDDNEAPIQIDECIETSGAFPRFLELPPTGDNGSYDPTLAGNPNTGRTWMVFSRVDGEGGSGKISTHLAYSDDNGNTWCYVNQINASSEVNISELPAEYAGSVSAHWSHEVPSLAYHPNADASERWQMTWHRYLHVDDGIAGNDDRKFVNGWIGLKKASSPELLASQPEIKLFAALGYYKDTPTTNFNNGIGGPPEIKLHELDPSLANGLVFTESGMHVHNNELYMSLLMGDLVDGNKVILIKQNPSGNWQFVSTLLNSTDALTLNSSWSSFSATDLFKVGDQGYLLVSPVSGLYEGLALFELDFNNGRLRDSDGDGPDLIWELPKTEGSEIIQTGVGTYDELCFNSGIIYGDAVVDSPQFRIYASGFVPD